MLTKDLLRVRRSRIEADPGTEVKPVFLKPGSKHAAYADGIVALFQASLGTAQGDLKEQALELAQGHGVEPLVARGLIKTCFDAAETEGKADIDYAAARKDVFLAAARLLGACSDAPRPQAARAEHGRADGTLFADVEEPSPSVMVTNNPTDSQATPLAASPTETFAPEHLRAAVLAEGNDARREFLARGTLYGDLPDESPLTAFPYQAGAELLARYNVSLVQSLLVNARSVVLTLPGGDRALLRRLWKAFRFFGLVVLLSPRAPGETEKDPLRVEVEGPLSLHMHSLKYGFSLAAFLPSLLCEKGWTLEARVCLSRGEESLLLLEPRAEIALAKRSFNQYTPPELALVLEALVQKGTVRGLTASECGDFLPLPGEAACFPDFEVTDANGRKAYVEVFHPWHRAAYEARVAQLERVPDAPLVLAVSRKIVKTTGGKAAPGEKPAGRASLLAEISTEGTAAEARGIVFFRETPLAGDLLDAAEKVMSGRRPQTAIASAEQTKSEDLGRSPACAPSRNSADKGRGRKRPANLQR